MQVDRTGTKFVTVSTDRRLRVFKFKTGKLMRTYDESIEASAVDTIDPIFESSKRPSSCWIPHENEHSATPTWLLPSPLIFFCLD